MRPALLAVAALAFSTSASALLPDNGWYWNPAESGRGFNIEIQQNLLFMSGFVYDATGNPIWMVAGGPMSSDRSFTGDLCQTTGGQCIGCNYGGAPQNVKIGTASVQWSDEMHAVITINGTPVNVQRHQFGIDLANSTTPMLGEWAFVFGNTGGIGSIYFGERVSFTSTRTLNEGTYAVGGRSGELSSRVAVSNFDPGTGTWAILLDSSTSFYTLFVFRFTGLNAVEGTSTTYRKTERPAGALNMVGHRVRSAGNAAGSNAPGVTTKGLSDTGTRDADLARLMEPVSNLDELLDHAARLERRLK